MVRRNLGLDTIQDFRSGSDVIGLTNNLVFEDLTFSKGSGGTFIKAGSEKIAFVQGVTNPLQASDFSQINLGNLNSLVQHDLAALKA